MADNTAPPTTEPPPSSPNHSGLFFLLFLLLLIIPLGVYIFLRRRTLIRSNRNPNSFRSYLPFASHSSTSSNSRSAFSTLTSKFSNLTSSLTGKKGYSGPPGGRTALFNRLDPDGAWDDRVGNEAEMFNYGAPDREYEEAELGGRQTAMPRYGGGAREITEEVDLNDDTAYHNPGQGLGQSEIDRRYDEEMGRGRTGASTPGARRSVFTEGV